MKTRSTGMFTGADLRQLRLRSQLLAGARPGNAAGPGAGAGAVDPAGTVRRLLAVQAQNLGGALWSVGQRTPGSTRGDVEAVLAAGVVVLTWPMRGTLHLIHADDADWLLTLLTPRAAVGRARIWQDAGLTEDVFEQAAQLLLEVTAHGPVPRPAVIRALNDAGIGTGEQRGSHILRYLAEQRLIIFGPLQGKAQTFMRYADRVPGPPDADASREELLRRLAVRYLTGHGPATAADLAWWSGLTLTDARAAVALAAPELAAVEVDGQVYYLDPEVLGAYPGRPGAAGAEVPAAEAAAVHLLPGFDEFHIGYADRALILSAEDQGRVGPGKNGMFKSPVIAAGVVSGTWSATERAGSVGVEVARFPGRGPVLKPQVDAAAHAYGRFLGRHAEVTLLP